MLTSSFFSIVLVLVITLSIKHVIVHDIVHDIDQTWMSREVMIGASDEFSALEVGKRPLHQRSENQQVGNRFETVGGVQEVVLSAVMIGFLHSSVPTYPNGGNSRLRSV